MGGVARKDKLFILLLALLAGTNVTARLSACNCLTSEKSETTSEHACPYLAFPPLPPGIWCRLVVTKKCTHGWIFNSKSPPTTYTNSQCKFVQTNLPAAAWLDLWRGRSIAVSTIAYMLLAAQCKGQTLYDDFFF